MERNDYALGNGWQALPREERRRLLTVLSCHYMLNLQHGHDDIAEHIQTLIKQVRQQLKDTHVN